MAMLTAISTPNSSFISWIGYPKSGEPHLIVRFHNGRRYLYTNVSRQRAVAMSRSRSVGQYYCTHIRGKYDSYRLHVEPPK